ncbi:MAG: AtpZ/AtpI family protein [Magnetococcales bacterium]|nr:AtpZ/AtpI family protein [Magnetococcales bacterium]
MGLGMRMATDMVVATLIGVGMGHYLDEWLGLHPWMTVLFFLFGAVAGFRAVYRAAQEGSSQAP